MKHHSQNIGVRSFAGSVVACFVLSGCGGGGGTGNLASDLGIVTGNFQIVTIATGARETVNAVPDLTTNAEYQTTKMVFRLVQSGTGTLGTASTAFGYQADESQGSEKIVRYSIGVFEVTQRQWELMGGTTPWTAGALTAIVGGSAIDDEKPAFALSNDDVIACLATYNSGKTFTMSMPSDGQWEFACRGGSSGSFGWGDSREITTIEDYAIVWETASGIPGPRVVGQRTPNGFGLYDMHGNVWEHTSDGNICGGSWNDTLSQARSANKLTPALVSSTGHPLVGVRLVLVVQ